MEVPCPHCNHVVSVPEAQRSWLPFVLIGLLGAFVLLLFGGFMVIAALTFPALTQAQSALAAERMAVEAAREQKMAARMQAEEALQRTHDELRSDNHKDRLKDRMNKQNDQLEESRRQLDDMNKFLNGLLKDMNDPSTTPEGIRKKLLELEKKAREEK